MWVVVHRGWSCCPRPGRLLEEETWLFVLLALVMSCLTLAVVYGMRSTFLLAAQGTVIEAQRHRSRLVVVWIRSILHVSRHRLHARSRGLD